MNLFDKRGLENLLGVPPPVPLELSARLDLVMTRS